MTVIWSEFKQPALSKMSEFSLLTLNTFGVPLYLGWERLGRLARQLNRINVSAICLQEIQQNAYTHLIQRGLIAYPYAAYERHLYAPKGGLATFSRLPCVQHHFEVYKSRGTWHSISFSDWATYKGFQSVSFEVGGVSIIVLNTHLNANYGGVWHQTNRLSQILHHQVEQLNQAIRSLPAESLVILCGDFNFPRNSFLYEELMTQNELFDPLADDERPTYRPFPLVPSKWKTSLDYVLVRPCAGKKLQVQADLIAIEDSSKKHPVQRFLTDHNALVVRTGWDSDNSS